MYIDISINTVVKLILVHKNCGVPVILKFIDNIYNRQHYVNSKVYIIALLKCSK